MPNDRDNQADLTASLFAELDAQARAELEAQLAADPDAAAELAELALALDALRAGLPPALDPPTALRPEQRAAVLDLARTLDAAGAARAGGAGGQGTPPGAGPTRPGPVLTLWQRHAVLLRVAAVLVVFAVAGVVYMGSRDPGATSTRDVAYHDATEATEATEATGEAASSAADARGAAADELETQSGMPAPHPAEARATAAPAAPTPPDAFGSRAHTEGIAAQSLAEADDRVAEKVDRDQERQDAVPDPAGDAEAKLKDEAPARFRGEGELALDAARPKKLTATQEALREKENHDAAIAAPGEDADPLALADMDLNLGVTQDDRIAGKPAAEAAASATQTLGRAPLLADATVRVIDARRQAPARLEMLAMAADAAEPDAAPETAMRQNPAGGGGKGAGLAPGPIAPADGAHSGSKDESAPSAPPAPGAGLSRSRPQPPAASGDAAIAGAPAPVETPAAAPAPRVSVDDRPDRRVSAQLDQAPLLQALRDLAAANRLRLTVDAPYVVLHADAFGPAPTELAGAAPAALRDVRLHTRWQDLPLQDAMARLDRALAAVPPPAGAPPYRIVLALPGSDGVLLGYLPVDRAPLSPLATAPSASADIVDGRVYIRLTDPRAPADPAAAIPIEPGIDAMMKLAPDADEAAQ